MICRAVEEAAEAAGEASQPTADLNGSPEYKRNLVRVLVKRCFGEALASTAKTIWALRHALLRPEGA